MRHDNQYTPVERERYIAPVHIHSSKRLFNEGAKLASHYSPVKEPIHTYHSEAKPVIKALPRRVETYHEEVLSSVRNYSAHKENLKVRFSENPYAREYQLPERRSPVREDVKECPSERSSPAKVITTRTYNTHGHVESHTTVDRVKNSPMKGYEEEEFVL